MSYARQDSVVTRLQAQNMRALKSQAADRHEDLSVLWRRASRALKGDIAAAYHASVGPNGRWDLTALHSSGTHHSLAMRVGTVLSDFLARSKWKAEGAFKDLRSESAKRHAWLLSQVTPESTRIKFGIPRHTMHEADRPLTSGFSERWGQWVQGYGEALMRNLRMGALNNSTATDAIGEVDATRVNTPAYTLESAMDRLYDYYSWDAITGGMSQVVDENPDATEEEIWRTSGDLRVCDDCDENEGKTLDDADGTIPLHPNCHCFPQLVPASYAELLRSGDEDDRELAEQMDLEGVAPNALVIRGDDGSMAAKAIVDFKDWPGVNAVAGGI